ncbi:phage late control D family protein, partial [Escherichia coli]|nr:phage late control D family protein [Escherichia coli]
MTDTTMQLLSQGTDPVKMPDFDILAEGKTLSGVAECLMSLSLTDNRGFEADQLTITLDDADGQLLLPPRGARLTVLIGWKGEPLTEKGTYIVDEIAHEGPPDRLTVSARSADFRDEFNVKREVSWHDVTVERVVSAIAHRYGLKPQISEMLMDIEIDHADQTEESDMSFLTRMA